MMKNKYVILAILIVITTTVQAQPGFDQGVDDVGTVPIPGILLAIAVAVGLGVTKLRSKKK